MMRVRRLDLIRYGKFTDHAIDFGRPTAEGTDLHVVYGLNEAGKSTALSGYLDLLFGIEERSRYGFLHQYNTMEVGAVLEFGGKMHELRRVKQRAASLRDASGQAVNEALLGGPLAGLTRDAYRKMFSLDDQTLEDGGNEILDSRGDLGELLFSASAGLAGLSKALLQVGNEAAGIFRKRASVTQIAHLKQRLGVLKAHREKIDTQANAHASLVAELKRAEQAYDETLRERSEAKARQGELGRLMRGHPLAAEHARVSEELATLSRHRRPPSNWSDELPGLMINDATLRTRLRNSDARVEQLRGEIDGIEIDRRLLQCGARLDGLLPAFARFQTALVDLPKRRAELSECNSSLADLSRSITGRADGIEPDSLTVLPATLGMLRGLIEEWSGIESKLEAAEKEMKAASLALERALEDQTAVDQDHPSLETGRKALLQTLVSRLREGDLLARRRIAERDLLPRKRALDDALRALAPWSGQADDLRTLKVPEPKQIQAWRTTLADQDLRRARRIEERRERSTKKTQLTAEISAVEAATGQIGDAEAAALREQREQAWLEHRQRLDVESASSFEQLMRAVDEMADARLANADGLAQLRGLRRDLKVANARIDREDELLAEVDQESADLATQIGRIFPVEIEAAAGASLGQLLSEIETWIKKRDLAIAALLECRKARDELEACEAEIHREQKQLADAVTSVGVDPHGLDLAALLQAAEAILSNDAAHAQARLNAGRLAKECVRTVADRRRASETAAEADRIWHERWRNALSGTWLADRAADLNAVRAILDAVGGLPAKLAERNKIRHRIEAMEEDRESFLTALAGLLGELDEHMDPNAASKSAEALLERYGSAKRDVKLRSGKESDLATIEQERVKLLDEIAVHDARKKKILDFFDLAELTDVGNELQRCAYRDRTEDELKKVASQLLLETESPSVQEALGLLAGTDFAVCARENAECATRIDDLDERLKSLFADKSRAADRLKEIGGDDAVARIDAERKTIMLEIEDRAMRFLHLKTGSLLAEQALHVYRDKHRGSMMRQASEAFRAITRDDYTGLATRAENDRESLIGLHRNGGSKLATDMSKGTRFQLYLALRLAGYEEFALARPAVPFVADDIMETFDEPRSEEVFRLLGKISKIGQVIYLTHHRHLCALATQTVPGVRTHELP